MKLSHNKINHVTPKQKKNGEQTGFRQLKICHSVKIVPMKICSIEVFRSPFFVVLAGILDNLVFFVMYQLIPC